MSLTSVPLRAAFTLVALAGLAGCTAAEPAPEPVATVDAEPSVEQETTELAPNPIEEDTVLIVRATATAPSGAELSLEMQVHQSTAWDYLGTQTLPAALIDDCGGTLDSDLFAAQSWSFTRVNVTAIPPATSTVNWPADLPISVDPSTAYAMTSGRGMLAVAAETDMPCLAEKSLAGPGRGGLAMGLPGDAGTFTSWVEHSYGFRVNGATLSDCTFEVPELGAQFGANTNWAQLLDAGTCVIGQAEPTREY